MAVCLLPLHKHWDDVCNVTESNTHKMVRWITRLVSRRKNSDEKRTFYYGRQPAFTPAVTSTRHYVFSFKTPVWKTTSWGFVRIVILLLLINLYHFIMSWVAFASLFFQLLSNVVIVLSVIRRFVFTPAPACVKTPPGRLTMQYRSHSSNSSTYQVYSDSFQYS